MRLSSAVPVVFLVVSAASAQNLFPAEIDLRDLLVANGGDGTMGFVVNVAGEPSQLGDINHDGIGDFAIGNHVFFGRTSFPTEYDAHSLLVANGGDGTEGFVLHGGNVTGRGSGDFNGDGRPESYAQIWCMS